MDRTSEALEKRKINLICVCLVNDVVVGLKSNHLPGYRQVMRTFFIVHNRSKLVFTAKNISLKRSIFK